jgi:hypothetical protein
MQVPDFFNGCFELTGGLLSILNIRKIYRDKMVRGFSPTLVAFVTVWGYWNLYYYPHLSQWLSFSGGVLLVICNTIWLSMIFYYLKHGRRERTPYYGYPDDEYEDVDAPRAERSVPIDPEMQRALRRLAVHEPIPDYTDNGVRLETIGYGHGASFFDDTPFRAGETRHEGDSRRRDR